MPIKLFDLVPQPGGVFFSPSCLRTRLALIHKQLPFEVEEVTYHDLRFVWNDRLGVQKATAPFVQREDGSYLMDSDEIAAYLDKEYPDRPNLFLPDAASPVDLDSAEYSTARQAAADFAKVAPPKALFSLYAPRIAKLLDTETRAYWISDARLGQGVWAYISSRTAEDEAKVAQQLQTQIATVTTHHLASSGLFFSSPSKPDYAVRPPYAGHSKGFADLPCPYRTLPFCPATASSALCLPNSRTTSSTSTSVSPAGSSG
ncbi:hypothetical protein AAT19DRAFT_15266 [Rhodotorula toruloides]|uniref:GST N-terminal domain-containing protein n=1 Tax=Rhodotorula toruloides TaxID=5286 RepID=A0A2T0A6R1_RHOTO|nr:hypothetical protein AAT19DRAFT_15266 [Rhodotorula toruloides]